MNFIFLLLIVGVLVVPTNHCLAHGSLNLKNEPDRVPDDEVPPHAHNLRHPIQVIDMESTAPYKRRRFKDTETPHHAHSRDERHLRPKNEKTEKTAKIASTSPPTASPTDPPILPQAASGTAETLPKADTGTVAKKTKKETEKKLTKTTSTKTPKSESGKESKSAKKDKNPGSCAVNLVNNGVDSAMSINRGQVDLKLRQATIVPCSQRGRRSLKQDDIIYDVYAVPGVEGAPCDGLTDNLEEYLVSSIPETSTVLSGLTPGETYVLLTKARSRDMEYVALTCGRVEVDVAKGDTVFKAEIKHVGPIAASNDLQIVVTQSSLYIRAKTGLLPTDLMTISESSFVSGFDSDGESFVVKIIKVLDSSTIIYRAYCTIARPKDVFESFSGSVSSQIPMADQDTETVGGSLGSTRNLEEEVWDEEEEIVENNTVDLKDKIVEKSDGNDTVMKFLELINTLKVTVMLDYKVRYDTDDDATTSAWVFKLDPDIILQLCDIEDDLVKSLKVPEDGWSIGKGYKNVFFIGWFPLLVEADLKAWVECLFKAAISVEATWDLKLPSLVFRSETITYEDDRKPVSRKQVQTVPAPETPNVDVDATLSFVLTVDFVLNLEVKLYRLVKLAIGPKFTIISLEMEIKAGMEITSDRIDKTHVQLELPYWTKFELTSKIALVIEISYRKISLIGSDDEEGCIDDCENETSCKKCGIGANNCIESDLDECLTCLENCADEEFTTFWEKEIDIYDILWMTLPEYEIQPVDKTSIECTFDSSVRALASVMLKPKGDSGDEQPSSLHPFGRFFDFVPPSSSPEPKLKKDITGPYVWSTVWQNEMENNWVDEQSVDNHFYYSLPARNTLEKATECEIPLGTVYVRAAYFFKNSYMVKASLESLFADVELVTTPCTANAAPRFEGHCVLEDASCLLPVPTDDCTEGQMCCLASIDGCKSGEGAYEVLGACLDSTDCEDLAMTPISHEDCVQGGNKHCCIPSQTCNKNGVTGICMDRDNYCDTNKEIGGDKGKTFRGFGCKGSWEVQCCLHEDLPSCTVLKGGWEEFENGIDGQCSWDGDYYCKDGLRMSSQSCPGRQCCIKDDIPCGVWSDALNGYEHEGSCISVDDCTDDSTKMVFPDSSKCPPGIVGPNNSAVKCCVPKPCVAGKGYYGGEDGISGISGKCSRDADCDGYNIVSTECSSNGSSKCCIPKKEDIVCRLWSDDTPPIKLKEGRCIDTDDCDPNTSEFLEDKIDLDFCPEVGNAEVKCCAPTDQHPPPNDACTVTHNGKSYTGTCGQPCEESKYGIVDDSSCPQDDTLGNVCCIEPIPCESSDGDRSGSCKTRSDCITDTSFDSVTSTDCPSTMECCVTKSTSTPSCTADEILVEWDIALDDYGFGTYEGYGWFLMTSGGKSVENIGSRFESSLKGKSCLPRNSCYFFFFQDQSYFDKGFDFYAFPDSHVLFKADGAVILRYDRNSDIWPYHPSDVDLIGGTAGFGETCSENPANICTDMGGTCVNSLDECNDTDDSSILGTLLCPGRYWEEAWCCLSPIGCTAHSVASGVCMMAKNCVKDSDTASYSSDDCPFNDYGGFVTCCHERPDVPCTSSEGEPGYCEDPFDCKDPQMGGDPAFRWEWDEESTCGQIAFFCCYEPFVECSGPHGELGLCGYELDCQNIGNMEWDVSASVCEGEKGCCHVPSCVGSSGESGTCLSSSICSLAKWDVESCSGGDNGCCYTPTPPTTTCIGPSGESGSCVSPAGCNLDKWDSGGCSDSTLGCCYIPDSGSTPTPPPPVETVSDTSFRPVGSASISPRGVPDDSHITFSMTGTTKWQTGAMWCTRSCRVDVTHSFEFIFAAYFGSRIDGGEGIVFAIQNDGTNALETTGGHFLGYGYKPGNATSFDARVDKSVGIEFDTDKYDGEYRSEIEENHISILRDGNIMEPIAGVPVEAIPGQANIKDNEWHDVWVKYKVETNELSVYFDDEYTARIIATVNIREIVRLDLAYWGFTASTGELVNAQKVTLNKSTYLKYL